MLIFGFEGKTPGTVIKELRAEVRTNKTYVDTMGVSLKYVQDLAEANTIMLCSIAPTRVTINMPCVRLERERGLR